MIIKYIVRLMANGVWVTRVQCDTADEVNAVLQVASEDTNIWYEKYMVETRQCEKGKPMKYGMPIDVEFGQIYHMPKTNDIPETKNKTR